MFKTKFYETPLMGVALVRQDRQTDGQTPMTKIRVVFRYRCQRDLKLSCIQVRSKTKSKY
jgi:hypothetical protein